MSVFGMASDLSFKQQADKLLLDWERLPLHTISKAWFSDAQIEKIISARDLTGKSCFESSLPLYVGKINDNVRDVFAAFANVGKETTHPSKRSLLAPSEKEVLQLSSAVANDLSLIHQMLFRRYHVINKDVPLLATNRVNCTNSAVLEETNFVSAGLWADAPFWSLQENPKPSAPWPSSPDASPTSDRRFFYRFYLGAPAFDYMPHEAMAKLVKNSAHDFAEANTTKSYNTSTVISRFRDAGTIRSADEGKIMLSAARRDMQTPGTRFMFAPMDMTNPPRAGLHFQVCAPV